MDANSDAEPEQLPTQSTTGYKLMSNLRDRCKQPYPEKCFLFTLGTYCDRDGTCYASSETLAEKMGVSPSTSKRMLRKLIADGEVEILEPGVGRSKKRVLRLTRYLDFVPRKSASEDENRSCSRSKVTCENGSRSWGNVAPNSHSEQPEGAPAFLKASTPKGSARTRLRKSFSPRLPYPKTEAALYAKLDELGIESDPTYDGNFFEQMQRSGWTIRGKPILDWPKAYAARLKKSQPQDFPAKQTAAQRMAAKRSGEYEEDYSDL